MRWYVFYGKHNNLGQISSLWLAYADKYGVDHKETLALHKMAQQAVQFVKTGEPVKLDRNRFSLRERPDFMAGSKKPSAKNGQYYTSHKAVGRLYRAARAYADKPPNAVDESVLDFANHLRIEGFERYVPAAREARMAYEGGLLYLHETYGVRSEAELVTGRVLSFGENAEDNSVLAVAHEPKREAEEAIRRAASELWVMARNQLVRVMEAAVAENASESSSTEKERVAAAWYVAAYEAPPTRRSDLWASFGRLDLPSFAWVAWPELLAIIERVGAVPPVPVRVIPEGVAMAVS